MGRSRVPTAIAKARGNPSKKTFSSDEANPEQYRIDELTPPAGLSPKAKKVWLEIVNHLHACGLYTVADQNTLSVYCEAFAEWQHAQKMVWRLGAIVGRNADGMLVKFEGKTVHDVKKFPFANPWVKYCNDAFNKMVKLIAPLGLSPASRSGLNVAKQPPIAGNGEFDEFD